MDNLLASIKNGLPIFDVQKTANGFVIIPKEGPAGCCQSNANLSPLKTAKPLPGIMFREADLVQAPSLSR